MFCFNHKSKVKKKKQYSMYEMKYEKNTNNKNLMKMIEFLT